MNRTERLKLLLQPLDPIELNIINTSAAHHGHAGDDGSGESHMHIALVSPRFHGMGRLQRHRLVMGLIAPEISAGLHAVELVLRAPGETH